MKLVTIVGNRPQFIKSAPLSAALREAAIDEIVVDRGAERGAFDLVGHQGTQWRRIADRPLHSQRVHAHPAVPHRVLTADRLTEDDGGSRVVDSIPDKACVP